MTVEYDRAMYPSPGMLAVPAASNVRQLQDLIGQPVVFGVRTSGLVTLARQVFSGIGLDIDRTFKRSTSSRLRSRRVWCKAVRRAVCGARASLAPTLNKRQTS